MIKLDEVVKIGTFLKCHGIQGELALALNNTLLEQVDPVYLICSLEGILVPFKIEKCRFSSSQSALVKFEDVDSEEYARRFINSAVYIQAELVEDLDEVEDTAFEWHDFEGFRLIDRSFGDIGDILSVDNSTMNTLFLVEYLGDEIMIPVDESLVDWVDVEKEVIQMNLPEGLLTLE